MGLLEDLADKLAEETLEIVEGSGDETIVETIAKAVGASSTTLEETFLTAVRIRRSALRGHEAIAQIRERLASEK